MKLSFFIQFSINTVLSFVETVVHNSKATDEQKAAADKLVLAAQEFLATFSN